MMKKYAVYLLTVFLILTAAACAGKPRAKEMDLAMSLTERAVNYNLQGQGKMAAFTYNRAIAKFRDMGKFCDMARVSILIYSIDGFRAAQALTDAKGFAALGECSEEMNIVNFLEGAPYSQTKLPEPYKAFSKYKATGKISYLISLSGSSETSDKIKSMVYRYIGMELLQKEPKKALKYVKLAKTIDEKYAWTRNLLKDESLMLDASQKIGLPTEIITERMNILEQAIKEKY